MLMYYSLLHIISNISLPFVHNIIVITTSRRYYNPIILTLSTVVIFGSFLFSIAIPNAFHFLQHMALGQYPTILRLLLRQIMMEATTTMALVIISYSYRLRGVFHALSRPLLL